MKLLITFAFLMFGAFIQAQDQNNPYSLVEKEAIQIVNDQLKAYNAHDIEAFCKTFSEDIKIYNYPNHETSSGIVDFRASFDSFFKSSPDLHCEITNRMVVGNRVIDHELVTGHSQTSEDELRVVAIYTVEEGLIVEVRFIYP